MQSLLLSILSFSTVQAYYIGEVYTGQRKEVFDRGWEPDWRDDSYINACTSTQKSISGEHEHLQGIGIINGAGGPGFPIANPRYGGTVPSGHNAAAMIFYKTANCETVGTNQFIVLKFRQLVNGGKNMGYALYRGVSTIDLNFLDGIDLGEYWSFQEVGPNSEDWIWVVESGVPEVEGEAIVWRSTPDGTSFEIAQRLEIRSPNPATASGLALSLARNDIEPVASNLRVALQAIAEMRFEARPVHRRGGNVVRIPLSSILRDYPLIPGPNANANENLNTGAQMEDGGTGGLANVRPVQIPPGRTFNIRSGMGVGQGPIPFRVPPTGSNTNLRNLDFTNDDGTRIQTENPGTGTEENIAGTQIEPEASAQLSNNQGEYFEAALETEEEIPDVGNQRTGSTGPGANRPFIIERQQPRGPIPIQPRPSQGQTGNQPQTRPPYYEMMQPMSQGPGNLRGQPINSQNMVSGGSRGVTIGAAYPQNAFSQPPRNRPEQGSQNINNNNQNSAQFFPINPGQAILLNNLNQQTQNTQSMIPGSNQNPSSQITAPETQAMIPETEQTENLPLQSSQTNPEVYNGPPINAVNFNFRSFNVPERAAPGAFRSLYGDIPVRNGPTNNRENPQRVLTEGMVGGTIPARILENNPNSNSQSSERRGTGRSSGTRSGLEYPYPYTDLSREEPYQPFVPPKRGDEKYQWQVTPGTKDIYTPYEGWLNEGEVEERAHFPELFENPAMELEADIREQELAENEVPPGPTDESRPMGRSSREEMYDQWRRYGTPILGNLRTLPIDKHDPNWNAIGNTYESMRADIDTTWFNYYQEKTDSLAELYKKAQAEVQRRYTRGEKEALETVGKLTAAEAKTKVPGLPLKQQFDLNREIQSLKSGLERLNKGLENLRQLWEMNKYKMGTWNRSYHRQIDDLDLRFKLWRTLAEANIARNSLRLLHIEDDPEFGTFPGEVPRSLDANFGDSEAQLTSKFPYRRYHTA
ncbi:hypothetical protein AOL_s00173g191 [Orbilia oligospora ATCC 24927]|uniref:Uncharacterized protein n=1 Tax=Arthrobotrys oligospora (strain ATCC 24927 / CBS 115.81 / DSM 1491) TaxID=756982 RepID=G1XP23_ARTOA|nr:hypothetical protein AOL_s00173g191 [Orbilia oligospora ATCC 24927]EGX45090.1 hypothetical protein AOL_s00173g191 [Orbilia oligospora ATCC 24927]